MQARAFWKAVTLDRADFLDRPIALLTEHGIRFCVVGGQAVNAYADSPYFALVDRAWRREVLGLRVPVASLGDVFRGNIWAVTDASRRPSRRQKDLADIARVLEAHPELCQQVPPDILARLES